MSQLKLKLSLSPKIAKSRIRYGNKLFLIGSCFTENIGAKLKSHLFEVVENPHGILFNPVSVHKALHDYISKKQYSKEDLFLLNDVWNSWDHHSRFSGVTQAEALEKINHSIQVGHDFLKTAQHLVITLGSAWLYHATTQAPNGNGQVVANNHKAPSQWFEKTLMKPATLIELLKELVHAIKSFNPSIHIVFTISPVRHLREGLVENNRSKAVLIHAVHEILANEDQLTYFPAYEYVIDDLRDYRFYAEDLVHPNYAATQYVWEQFIATFVDEDTVSLMKQVAEIQLAVQHKPFFVGSAEHQKFIRNCIVKTEILMRTFPFLPLEEQLLFFKGQVLNNT